MSKLNNVERDQTMRHFSGKSLSITAGLLVAQVPAYGGGTNTGMADYLDSVKESHGTGNMPVLSFPSNLPNPLIFYTFPSGQIKTLDFPGGVFVKIGYAGEKGIRFKVVKANSQGKLDWTAYDELHSGVHYVIKKELPPSSGH